jgi:hypothetical protein
MPQAIGGYTSTTGDSPPTAASGTILVQGAQKASVFSTNPQNVETGALWLDTGFSVHAQQTTLSFDINVLQAPSSLTGPNSQVMTINGGPTTAGILFGARMYNSNNGQWAFSVAVVPTSATGGVLALRNATNTDLTTFGSYTNGQTSHVTVIADYDAGTASARDDSGPWLSGYALRGGVDSNATFSEMFMYMNGESGGLGNSLSIDNIAAYDYANTAAAVPEPTTMLVWGLLGLVGAGYSVWRRKRAA